jgi:hypothetical protein
VYGTTGKRRCHCSKILVTLKTYDYINSLDIVLGREKIEVIVDIAEFLIQPGMQKYNVFRMTLDELKELLD